MLDPRIAALLSKEKGIDRLENADVLKLSVEYLRGIGPEYSKKLKAHGINVIMDLLKKEIPESIVPNKLLSKWKIAADIIKTIAFHNEKEPRIIFSGLASAGKTSIINLLKNIKTEAFPTLGARNEVFNLGGNSLRIIDMGGQEKFRNQYLKLPEKFFLDTQIVFYVIDVLNLEVFNDTVKYLERVLQTFRYLRINPFFAILLHKYDPDKAYKLKYTIRPYTEKLSKILQSYWEFKFKVFYTSIFNPTSLYLAASQTLSEVYPILELINNLLKEFVLEKNFDGAVLIDEKGVLLARYFKDESETDLILNQIYGCRNEIISKNIDSFSSIVMRKRVFNPEGALIVQKIFLSKGIGYTFYWNRDVAHILNVSEPALAELTQNLNPWLFNLFQLVNIKNFKNQRLS